ncbi:MULTISPECIES: tape measure protein [unclassified Chryseobacterium]|uniref:tape measure protein n=1 Tax=unclassified Chryseobacterium TaxID=2593645 RepID=UPI0028530FA5|nr:tape measure protein [Chryseobacterium sp. CFS7]MDR4892273.1 tape measure protein [Chryseobacterium sp. CFS7]
MNTNNGALYFGAGIDTTQFRRDIDSMRRDILGLSQSTIQETQNMDSAFKSLSVGIASYFSFNAMKGFTMEVIKVRGEFQMMENAIETITGSKSKMDQLMTEWKGLTLRSPFRLSEIGQAGKQLLAYGIDVNKVTHDIEMLGNVASGVSAPIGDIAYVYGTLKTQGRAYTRDILQFTMRGIPLMEKLAEVMNVDETEMKGLIEAGKVGFPEVEKAMNALTTEGGKFNNLIGKQATTLTGAVNRLKHEFELMLNEIGAGNESLLSGGINNLSHLVENYREVSKSILELISVYGLYKAAVITTDALGRMYNMTIQSEIALLGISEKMKLGRALVTQRQAEATAREAAAELANTRAKYSALQVEVSSLAIKKQSAIQSGITATAKAQEAAVQLSLARMELSAIQATGTAREIEIAQKRVSTAQNTVIATQETASIARKRALAVSTEFNAAKQQLENTAQAVGVAEKTAATAAETAQIAAKNANATATTRLTAVQRIQTFASLAGAKAQAFLNATLMSNPYATVIVLLGVLTYSIYKAASATSELQKIQEEYNENLKRTNQSVNEQKTKVETLIKAIKDQSTSYDDANKMVNQLNRLTENRIKGLSVEAIRTGQADKAVQAYNKTLERNAEAMLKVQEIARWEEELKSLEKDVKTFSWGEAIGQAFNPFNDDYWSINPENQKKEKIAALKKTISDAIKDVKKAVKEGFDINGGSSITEEKPYSPAKFTEEWYDQEIERLEALKKKTVVGSKKWNEYEAEIERIRNLVSPKKQKEENQIAEIFPIGSPKQIQQQMQLLDDAIAVMQNGMVKIRKLDKFGHDKDKQGNPFLTGEIISLENANKRRAALQEKYDEISYKTSQEKFDLAKKQWENYYKSIEYFGKDEADKMYQGLFKGSNSFLQYIDNEILALNDRAIAGERLTKSDYDYLLNLKSAKNTLTGIEEPIEIFKREFENTLKLMPSYVDQIEAIEKAIDDAYQNERGNSDMFLTQKRFLDERKRSIIQQQKEIAIQFVNEQETAEQKALVIKQKYEEIRKQIGENSSYSEQERLRLLGISYKNEAKEISEASLEVFQKSDLFIKAFGDLERVGPSALRKLKKALEEYIQSAEGEKLGAEQLKVIQDQLRKIDDQLNKDPFASIGIAISKYTAEKKKLNDVEKKFGKNSPQYNEQLENTRIAFGGIVEATAGAVSGIIGFTTGLGDALGTMSESTKKTLKDVEQLGEGISNLVQGYFKQNYAQAAGGLIQTIAAVSSLIGGDNAREKQIQDWQRVIESLKNTYQDLQRTIEKTAGQESISRQKELINNLKEQQKVLNDMRDKEFGKKKADKDKISQYEQQMNDINRQIEDLVTKFKESVTTVEFKELSQKLADSLIEAFGQGEDAAKSFDKVVEDVMKNAVVNALRIKYLEPVVKEMVDNLYASMGYGKGDQSKIEQAIKETQAEIEKTQAEINASGNFQEVKVLEAKRMQLQQKINDLKAQLANTDIDGAFDGLTQEEIDKLKDYKNDPRYKAFLESIKSIKEVFENTTAAAQGLKGDIKGITEKTAGALEGQFNAVRINISEVLKIMKGNQTVANAQTVLLSKIESNTSNLIQIRKDMAELNNKIKPGLAGIP